MFSEAWLFRGEPNIDHAVLTAALCSVRHFSCELIWSHLHWNKKFPHFRKHSASRQILSFLSSSQPHFSDIPLLSLLLSSVFKWWFYNFTNKLIWVYYSLSSLPHYTPVKLQVTCIKQRVHSYILYIKSSQPAARGSRPTWCPGSHWEWKKVCKPFPGKFETGVWNSC